ncbi:MAG: uracil-DNA glycosylase [Pseudomonadota bacterium]
MEQGPLSPRDEIRAVVGQLKELMIAHREMGLDPPSLSASSLDYLNKGPAGRLSLESLREFIGDCRRCKLSAGRTSLVFGEGSPRARLVFVGEGPGQEEDRMGRPFVGEAGKLLDKIIQAMGLSRKAVYICNVVKCRPPKNRDPEPDEIAACVPFLKAQLRLIGPEVICVLGRIAGQVLFGEDFKISHERGKWRHFMDIPVMPTYHPAYLLRNPSSKREVWDDVQKIMGRLGLEVKRND